MKVLLNVYERNGEYEYNTKVLLDLEDGRDLEEYVDNYARDWYGSGDTAEQVGHAEYYLNGAEIYVSVSYEIVADEDYVILRKYL